MPFIPIWTQRAEVLHKELFWGGSRRMTAPVTPLTCTQPSRLVRRGGQQALEASVVLAEDDRPSLTALHAVTIYCIAFPEGRWANATPRAPSGLPGSLGWPRTVPSCLCLSKTSISSLSITNTSSITPGLLAEPNPSQTASKPELQKGPHSEGSASQWPVSWGHETSLQQHILQHNSPLTPQCWAAQQCSTPDQAQHLVAMGFMVWAGFHLLCS